MQVQKRNIGMWVLISFFTCGFGFMIWWFLAGQDIRALRSSIVADGRPVDRPNVVLDFVLIFLTCGLWGLYVDWKWAEHINEIKEHAGLRVSSNLPAVCLIADLASAAVVSTIMFQSEINKVVDSQTGGGAGQLPGPGVRTGGTPGADGTTEEASGGAGGDWQPPSDEPSGR